MRSRVSRALAIALGHAVHTLLSGSALMFADQGPTVWATESGPAGISAPVDERYRAGAVRSVASAVTRANGTFRMGQMSRPSHASAGPNNELLTRCRNQLALRHRPRT